jgi:ABC-type glycerol-3-phosphate transport system permease component
MAEQLTRIEPEEVIEREAGLLQRWKDRRQRGREGMDYLETFQKKFVTVYLPVLLFLFVLLFPFYWMGLTSIKPDNELIDQTNPWWVRNPTLAHYKKLLFETEYPAWMLNTMMVAVTATFLSIATSVMAAYAIVRIRYRGSNTILILPAKERLLLALISKQQKKYL